MQAAEHDSVSAVSKQQPGFLQHLGELRLRVAETRTAGPHHAAHGDGRLSLGAAQGGQRGRKSAQGKRRVKLRAVSSAPLGSHHVGGTSAADLNKRWHDGLPPTLPNFRSIIYLHRIRMRH